MIFKKYRDISGIFTSNIDDMRPLPLPPVSEPNGWGWCAREGVYGTQSAPVIIQLSPPHLPPAPIPSPPPSGTRAEGGVYGKQRAHFHTRGERCPGLELCLFRACRCGWRSSVELCCTTQRCCIKYSRAGILQHQCRCSCPVLLCAIMQRGRLPVSTYFEVCTSSD